MEYGYELFLREYTTSEQRRFLSVCESKCKPQTMYELAWLHYCEVYSDVKTECEKAAREKKKIEMDAQVKRAIKSDTIGWSGNYTSQLGALALTDRHTGALANDQNSSSGSKKWASCKQCGGDGGVGGRCPRCGGDGFEH